ncbi:MAG: PorP/SprF family type IX secretion system membrane protein [Bacteroidota bacterium]
MISSTLFLFAGLLSTAQQTPIYSQYFLNPFLFNPAKAGASGPTRAFFLYRNQWAGVEGSPETQAVTIDGRLKNEQIGLGFTLFNDVTNVIGRINGSLTGAYRFHITDNQRVSFGMSLQLIQNRIFFDRIVAEDITDPNLLNQVDQKTSFDANFGFSYQWEKLEFGLAADQLLQNEVNFENASQFQSINYTYVRHYIAMLSYEHELNDRLSVKPILINRLVSGRSSQFDANVVLTYDKKVWLSGAYRHAIGVGGSVGFHFDDQFTIGYAYEFPNSDLSILGTGTHEFVFGIKFNKGGTRSSTSNATGSSFRRKDLKSIQDENQEQFEKISQLEQDKERRKSDQEQTEALIDRQEIEILRLKQTILELQGDMEELQQETNYVPTKKSRPNDEANYYLVVGAFRELGNAKAFQKIIKREGKLDARVIQNQQATWYLIYTEELQEKDLKRINAKIKALEKGPIGTLLVGTPWVFEKKAE